MAATCLFGIMIIALPAYILAVKIRETSLQQTMGLLYGVVILTLVGKGLEPFYSMLGLNALTSHWLQIFFIWGFICLCF